MLGADTASAALAGRNFDFFGRDAVISRTPMIMAARASSVNIDDDYLFFISFSVTLSGMNEISGTFGARLHAGSRA